MTDHLVPFALAAGEGERLTFAGAEIVVRASSDATGGSVSIIEEIEPLDTPRHVHEREDELFYVLEGEHVIEVGEQELHVGPGDLVFGPRGVPHAQRRLVPRTGRLLDICTPGGLDGFFRELAEAESVGWLGSEAYATVSARYGITWL